MAPRVSAYLFLFLLSCIACSSGISAKDKAFQLSRKELLSSFNYKATEHDLIDPPSATNPTAAVSNPVITPSIAPPDNSSPTIVTVPATNPVAITPNPVSTPGTIPSTTPFPMPNTNPVSPTVPVTNPVTTPNTNPGAVPVTNPVTTPTTPGLPVTAPVTNPTPTPATTNAPAIPGQSWCVAKSGLMETALQSAIDYACGMGGADCSAIQQGGICYNPNTLQNHASFAFNSYYQKNPLQTSCDFGGTAMITNANPSSGSCIYPTTSSGSASPLTSSTPGSTPTTASSTPGSTPTTAASTPGSTPTTASSTPGSTPTTASSTGSTVPTSSGTPPAVLNASNPTSGGSTEGFGDSPPTTSTSSISSPNNFQHAVGSISLVASIITGIIVF